MLLLTKRFLPLALLLFCSCSESSTPAPPEPFEDGLEATLLQELSDYWLDRCVVDSFLEENDDEQLARSRDFYAERTGEFAMGFASDAATLDVAVAMECLQSLRATEMGFCPAYPPLACTHMFVGALSDGEGCQLSAECADGVCHHGGDCSYCKAYAAVGESCEEKPCNLQTSTCFEADGGARVCRARGDVGATCQSYFDCREGALCVEGACIQPADDGEACSTSNPCQKGFACHLGVCGRVPLEGEPCRENGIPCARAPSLTCRFGVCQPPESVGLGEACDPFYVASPARVCAQVQTRTWCHLDETSGDYACVARPGHGESCENIPCAFGSECEDVDGTQTCVKYGQVGDACGEVYPYCVRGSVCDDDNVCTAQVFEACIGASTDVDGLAE